MKNNLLRKMTIFVVFSLTIAIVAKYKLIEVKAKNMGKKINSKGDDYSPSFTADGFTMIFSSKRDGKKYQDIYISDKIGNEWNKAKALKVLNSPYNDETPFISGDGKLIIFSSDRDGSLEMPKNTYGQIKVSGDLYWSRLVNGHWTAPVKVPGQVNTIHHERSPSLSSDGKTLYYSSWPFGDINKSRIMKATLKNGIFLNPTVLPSVINSGNQELALSLAPKDDGMYFSSRRPGGYGGWDLYYVSYKNGVYGKVENLGPYINSSSHELYISKIKNNIYFCSNRKKGYGRYDIYGSETKKDDKLKFIVKDKITKKPIQTNILFSASLGKNHPKVKLNKKTNSLGKVSLQYNSALNKIGIFISKKGYFPYLEKIATASIPNPFIIELNPLNKKSFSLHSINFDYNSAKIKKKSYPYLDGLVHYLKENSNLKFLIIGHTDLHGSQKFNLELSRKRAVAIKQYLKNKGIYQGRFKTKGMGKKQPLINKIGKGFDEVNRRTEFQLLN